MRKRRVTLFLFLMFFGLIALLNILGKPRLAAVHGSDIVQLVASGMCFGVALGVLFGPRRFPDE